MSILYTTVGGLDVTDESGWRDWIRKARESEIIGNKWCDIQLKRRFSIIRMTSSLFKPYEPKLFYEVSVES